MNLFVYGTLRNERVWIRVVGGSYEKIEALLDGYAAKKVKGAEYPGLIEKSGSTVSGAIYRDVSNDDLRRLDHFEGAQYRRISVQPHSLTGARYNCETYLYRNELRHRLEDAGWDYEKFLSEGLGRFLVDDMR